jgi:DNA-binding CsgD family transcriptional regulator
MRMKPRAKEALEKRILEMTPASAEEPESGLVLVNTALQPIASDRGAVNILQRIDHSSGNVNGHAPVIPEVILDRIRSRRSIDPSDNGVSFSLGGRRYRCRFYSIQSDHPTFGPGVVALHFDIDSRKSEPIADIVAEYHLTEREEQALRGIALGLSTKEIADRMRISPNTVKSFVRLVMIKLGVTSRAAIMVKLLESYGVK